MSEHKRILVTAALPYANGPKHIGHLAGAYLPADIYARYQRLKKRDVLFVCGSDEHGTAIPIQAKKENTTPREIINTYHKLLKSNFAELGISFDIYHRTSEPIHHETAQELFVQLYNNEAFTEEVSEQYYDEKAESFLADRYIKGTCPNCSHPNAYGDQCEKCGKSLTPRDLINPVSTITGNKPILKQTKHWYLPLQEYEAWLREWILEGHKDDWKTNVLGQCRSWIDGGLAPRAMTRDLDWGVPVPLPNADGKVMYVWFDAPIGYISATKAYFKEVSEGKLEFATPHSDAPVHAEDWRKYWQQDDSKLVHFIGKDNIVFHCIIFPAILKAAGNYILPTNVPANEFLNLEGEKMSTSRKWSLEMHDFLADFPDKVDVLRYTLTAIAPETKDADFTWKEFQLKNNSELVAILGNFINRVMVLMHKYYTGIVPEIGELQNIDNQLRDDVGLAFSKMEHNLEHYHFRDAQFEMMNIARAGNKYLADNEPWKLIKTDAVRTATVLNQALQVAAILVRSMEPFIPFSAKKLQTQLNLSELPQVAHFDIVPAGHQLNAAELLFSQLEDSTIEAQVTKLKAAQEKSLAMNATAKPQKDPVTFDDFMKMDIRIGKVLEAEKVAKSDKLLKLLVDTGIDTRTVVSGIAKSYSPEEIVGKQVTMLVNLAPRKIMNIESQGMILMAENAAGKLALVQPDSDEMPAGAEVR